CNRDLETLQHLLHYPALTQQWKNITDSMLNFLHSLTTRLRICTTLSEDSNDLFPHITDFPDADFTPPTQALATGVFLAYLELDLYKWNIRSHLKIISTGLIKHTMSEFQKHIWISCCSRNAEKEKHLGITHQEKRSSSSSCSNSHNTNSENDVPGLYQILLKRWKRNWMLGHSKMARFVQQGSKGFN